MKPLVSNSPVAPAIAFLILAAASLSMAASPSGLWEDTAEKPLLAAHGNVSAAIVRNNVLPSQYRTLHLDRARLEAALGATLPEWTLRNALAAGAPADALPPPAVVELPIPRSTAYERFTVELSPVMEPGLAAKYPDIRTYIAQGIDRPELSARLDVTPLGFHAMILSPEGQVFIDPYFLDGSDPSTAIAYYKTDFTPAETMNCLLSANGKDPAEAAARAQRLSAAKPTGSSLRVYRLAVGTTAEYSAAVGGGDVTMTLAAVVTTVNRVSAVYERDFAIRMVLVNNEDKIIYTNGASQPYTNANSSSLLTQNQTTCDSIIGTANYDIGHVFSTGGGGLAGLRVVCVNGSKARGETGQPNPIGDPYDIDYVAHEMGHQFGGNHTFNSTTQSCSGNRVTAHAYEPGSGTTIMAYAGICSTATSIQDLGPHSDDYFHTTSYDEIDAYTTTGAGASVVLPAVATGNTPPTVAALTAYTIPISTPFALTASATDPDSDKLTYCWEEFDLGGAVNATSTSALDNGASPLFRSYAPTTNPTRTFPSLTYILNNANVPPLTGTADGNFLVGEALPSLARASGLNFRCTVRDNRAGGGGSDFAQVKLTVAAGAGPFAITAPESSGLSYPAGALLPVTWNVANTSASPVSCANVRISLSTDGGLTFPFVLAANVPNNGSASVALPTVSSVATAQARIKVEAVGNIFFDVNGANFTITSTNTPPTFAAGSGGFTVTRGTPGVVSATVGTVTAGSSALAGVSVSGAPDGAFVTGAISGGNVILSATAECRLTTTLTTRTYPLNVTVTDGSGASSSGTVNLLVAPNPLPTLGAYANFSVGQGSSATLTPAAAPADPNGNLRSNPLSLSPTTPLPAGVTLLLNQTTGAARFTATNAAAFGTSTLRLQLQDTCGATAERTFTLSVGAFSASAPVFVSSTPAASAPAGAPYSYQFTADGAPSPTYSVTGGALPPGLSLDSATGLLSGTPTTRGVYGGIRVTASNGVPTSPVATFSITVSDTASHYASSFGLTGADAAPTADFDADGLTNLLEYALNLNPTVSNVNSPGLPQSQVAVRPYGGGNYLSIRFTRVPLATDITYLVQGSPDLVAWTTIATAASGAAFSGPGVVSDNPADSSPHTVEVRDIVPQSDPNGTKRFLRLVVTQP